MNRWLESEEQATGQAAANVVAVVITNDLVVSGSPSQLETFKAVVRELDRPKAQIHVRAMIVDLTLSAAPTSPAAHPSVDLSKGDFSEIVAQLKGRGDLRVLAQPELLCADNQPAFLQHGSRVPRVTGASASSRGRTRQVTLENVGTMLGVTCRVSEHDLVTLEIDLERSHLGSEDEGTPVVEAEDGSIVRAPEVKTLTLQTTVSLRSGQTVVLGGMVHQTGQRWGELLLILQPKIVTAESHGPAIR
jgi:general secretion pathway protein D